MRVYYAHSIALYNTPQEKRDHSTLFELGFTVTCPNTPYSDEGYKREGMEFFKKLIADCDCLAFRANPDMTINAGVAREIEWAQEMGKPVIEIPSMVARRTLTVDATRQLLREWGVR